MKEVGARWTQLSLICGVTERLKLIARIVGPHIEPCIVVLGYPESDANITVTSQMSEPQGREACTGEMVVLAAISGTSSPGRSFFQVATRTSRQRWY